MPDSAMVDTKKFARPPGYSAQTRLFFGGLAVPMLLDYGATVSAMPEELACVILQAALDKVQDGTLSRTNELYPISRIETYTNPGELSGVAHELGGGLGLAHRLLDQRQLIETMLQIHPTDRPTVDELCGHPWVTASGALPPEPEVRATGYSACA